MALTLREAITATQTTFDVDGGDTLDEGAIKQIGAEKLLIRRAYVLTPQYGETVRQRLTVQRGIDGTSKASHAATAALSDVSAAGGDANVLKGVLVFRDATHQTVAVNTSATVEWEAEVYDDDDYFTLAAPTDLIAPRTGVYRVDGQVQIDDDAGVDGVLTTRLLVNGGGNGGGGESYPVVQGLYNGTYNALTLSLSGTLRLMAADAVSLEAQFEPFSGGTTYRIRGTGSYLGLTYLGATP